MEQRIDIPHLISSPFSQIEFDSLLCSGKQIAQYICANENCSNPAFLCNTEDCTCKTQKHQKCTIKQSVKNLIESIDLYKKQIPQNVIEMINENIRFYDTILEKISEDRTLFIQYVSMFGFTESMIKFVRLMTSQKIAQINGEMIHNIRNQMKKQQIYVPIQMTNYDIIKDSFARSASLLNKLNFQLTSSIKKIDMALQKVCREVITSDSVTMNHQHWEFIPIQVSMFTKLTLLNLSMNSIRQIENLDRLQSLETLQLYNNQIHKIQGLERLTNLLNLNLCKNLQLLYLLHLFHSILIIGQI